MHLPAPFCSRLSAVLLILIPVAARAESVCRVPPRLNSTADREAQASDPLVALDQVQSLRDHAPSRYERLDGALFETPAAVAGIRKEKQGSVSFLAIDPGATWSYPLGDARAERTFVTVAANASLSTVVAVAGVKISLRASERLGYAEIVTAAYSADGAAAPEWKQLGYHVRQDRFGGRDWAALPLLTVQLDRAARVWHLYCGLRHLASGPAAAGIAESDRPRIEIVAGTSGAALCGVVISEQNPLFADANANGIDDRFELAEHGVLLAAGASPELTALTEKWRESLSSQWPRLRFSRPLPDRLLAREK